MGLPQRISLPTPPRARRTWLPQRERSFQARGSHGAAQWRMDVGSEGSEEERIDGQGVVFSPIQWMFWAPQLPP